MLAQYMANRITRPDLEERAAAVRGNAVEGETLRRPQAPPVQPGVRPPFSGTGTFDLMELERALVEAERTVGMSSEQMNEADVRSSVLAQEGLPNVLSSASPHPDTVPLPFFSGLPSATARERPGTTMSWWSL
mmetsp:Transcript_45193/g.104479  ORF Transcript_45193/g.104479 Transcript_45193/m.104479 type:complete len:133 (-) Transcript_45193:133-531(-)